MTTHAYSLVVSLIETRVTVTSSSSQSVFGQTLTISATVTTVPPGSGTPTGTVTFTVDGVEQPPVDLVDGVATLRLTGLSIGTHTITASYSGDGTHATSTSSVFPQIVLAVSTIPALGLPGAALLALLLAIGGFRLARG